MTELKQMTDMRDFCFESSAPSETLNWFREKFCALIAFIHFQHGGNHYDEMHNELRHRRQE